MSVAAAPAASPSVGHAGVTSILDTLILTLAVGTIGLVLFGRSDRAWIADHPVAELLVALLVTVPLRIVLGGQG